jgi:group I intron endonuclease
MTIGIYAIVNNNNGKAYIGKSVNIEARWWAHRNALNKDIPNTKKVNRHLWNAWKKHGESSFTLLVLKELETVDDVLMSQLELEYIDSFDSCNRNFGYNLRRDSSTKMIVHDETRELLSVASKGERNPNFGNKWTDEQRKAMSEIQKKRNEEFDLFPQERRDAISKASTELWKDNDKLRAMSKKVAETTSTLRFLMYDKKTGELVRVWNSMSEILEAHPEYHRISIYSCCNGWKKSYKGFVWKSELKE